MPDKADEVIQQLLREERQPATTQPTKDSEQIRLLRKIAKDVHSIMVGVTFFVLLTMLALLLVVFAVFLR